MESRRKQFEQSLKQKLSQKCTANQSEEQMLVKSFKFFDISNSGEVDFSSFSKAVAKMGVVVDPADLEQYFQVYDSNGSGTLDYKEFSDIVFGKAQAQSQGGRGQQPQGSSMTYKGLQDPKPLVDAFRDKIKSRGARGLIGLQRVFKIMDDDNSKSLDKNEFRKAVNDFRVGIPADQIDTIFNAFDLNRDGTIDYDEFVRIIRGDLTPNRLALVKKAYSILDRDGSGVVDINDIKDVYNASKHPDVISGKKTTDQILVEFLETFEMHHNIQNNSRSDGSVTLDEFIEYYTNISASLDNDEYFAQMMNSSWNLSGNASQYNKYEKGWATASPEKKNQYVGEQHKGYVLGSTANKMIVQKTGMVSSENPLSTTTRHYQNAYEAKRTEPSVANVAKEQRQFYQRSGEESKSNPLVHTSEHYEGHRGKKIDERVEKPSEPKPKYQVYMLQRIKDKCVARGERGLFGLKRLFQTFDQNGNGMLEFNEFKRALTDFKLDLEEEDITNIFRSFDRNGDGVLSLEEFMEMILGQLNGQRLQAVEQAFSKLDQNGRGSVLYAKVRDQYDGKKHPDVCNGKKSEQAAISDFLEIFEVHHNTYNGYQRQDNVTKDEFMEFYRTLNPSYEDDSSFVSMVRGVWGVTNNQPDVSQRGWAGGNDTAQNSRDRYTQANQKGTPFGTSNQDSTNQWASSTQQNYKPISAQDQQQMRGAGGASKQSQYGQSQNYQGSTQGDSGAELLERFRERMAQRGARGILGLKRVFKIMDDDNSGYLDKQEFNKALKDYRVQVSADEGNKLFNLFDLNGDGNISYDELLRGVVGEMNPFRRNFVKRAFDKLDRNKNGVVELDDIKDVYNAKQHPDVKLGKKTEEEVLSEFLDTFELHYSLAHPNSRDKKINFDEFIEYYNNISMSIEDDRYFELMITNAWNLNNTTTTKAWGAYNQMFSKNKTSSNLKEPLLSDEGSFALPKDYQASEVWRRSDKKINTEKKQKIKKSSLDDYLQKISHDIELQSEQKQQITTLFQIWSFNNSKGQKVYQKGLTSSQTISKCSIHDNYAAFIIKEDAPHLGQTESEKPETSTIYAIGLDSKEENYFENIMRTPISAIYIDEQYLIIGSGVKIQCIPTKMVISDGSTSPMGRTNDFQIPDSDVEIYAFWRGKFGKDIEIFTKELKGVGIRVYNYQPTGSQRKTKVSQGGTEGFLNQVNLVRNVNLEALKLSQQMKSERKLRITSGGQTSLKLEDNLTSVMNSFKNSPYDSTIENDQFQDRSPTQFSMQEAQKKTDEDFEMVFTEAIQAQKDHLTIQNEESVNISDSNQSEYQSRQSQNDEMNFDYRKSGINTRRNKSPLKLKLQDKLNSKINFDQNDCYTRMKFQWRSTIAFRKSGQVDYISSDGAIHSSLNLDFSLDSQTIKTNQINEIEPQQKSRIKVIDAFVHGYNMYIVVEKHTVHCFNIQTLTCVKTTLTPQQVQVLPYQDYLKIFTDFLIYDNQILISHGPILTVCNVNGRICGEKYWRHLHVKENHNLQTLEQQSQLNSFQQYLDDIRLIKLRESSNKMELRVVILYQNNNVRTCIRNPKLFWDIDQNQKGRIPGIILDIVSAPSTNSAVLLLHKDDSSFGNIKLLNFDYTDDLNIEKMTVLDDLNRDDQVFTINASDKYMRNLVTSNLKIAIYNDSSRTLRIMQLSKTQEDYYNNYFGHFQQLHSIEKVKIHPSDKLQESGSDRYIYLARENKIYKFYLHESILTESLELFVEIPQDLSKTDIKQEIQSFKTFENEQFIYVSSQSNVYFNLTSFIEQKDSMLLTAVAQTNQCLYFDESYNRLGTFRGPFQIKLMPYLHLNRVCLSGFHHETQAVFYQHRGDYIHMLTSDQKLKTWSMVTGKMKTCFHQTRRYKNYKMVNQWQGKTLLCKQKKKQFIYHYLLLEIVSPYEIIEHACVLSDYKGDLYINSTKEFLFRKDFTQRKRNCFEICSFDYSTGDIYQVLKTFDFYLPVTFLSPSFGSYIKVDKYDGTISVYDTFTNEIQHSLPRNLRKNIVNKSEDYQNEDIESQIIFIKEDLLLIDTLNNYEIIFSLRQQQEILIFNKLKSAYQFNSELIPQTHDRQINSQKGKILIQNVSFAATPIRGLSDLSVAADIESQWWELQLADLMFLSHKKYRGTKFIVNQAKNKVSASIRDDEAVNQAQNQKLYSVLPFSFILWKLIETTPNSQKIDIKDINPNILALMCFITLPATNETFMHKLIKKDSEGLIHLLEITKKPTWPDLGQKLPHMPDYFGKTPLKLAYELNIRRLVDTLMTYLKDYPLDYCTEEISSLLPNLIQANYIARVGDYLDSRLLVPEWTQNYRREQLIIREDTAGLNFASSTYLPSTSHSFETKFYSDKALDVPIKMQLLDAPNLHLIGDENSKEFLDNLIMSGDLEIFERKSIKALIDYQWDFARKTIITKLFIPFMLYLAYFQFFLSYIFQKEDELSIFGLDHRYSPQVMLISRLILILFAFYFLIHEAKLLMNIRKDRNLLKSLFTRGNIWSLVDVVPMLVTVIAMTLDSFISNDHLIAQYERSFYAIACLLLWIKVFYFLRMYRNLGYLVRLVFFVIYQIRYYFVVFFCFILAFGQCFYILSENNPDDDKFIHSYLDGIKFIFFITMNRFDPDDFGSVNLVLVWTMFILSTLLFSYILMSLTVAMMKTYYDQTNNKREQNAYRVFAMMIIESYDMLEDQSNQLKTKHDYNEQHLMKHKKSFAIRLVDHGFVNQYLITAQPDSEEFRPKPDLTVIKLDELKEMLQQQINILKLKEDEAIEKIDQELLTRIVNLEEKQSSQFEQLEKNQQQIMDLLGDLIKSKNTD